MSVISRVNNTPSSGARIWMLSKLSQTRLPCPAWLMRSRPEDRGCRQGSLLQQGPRQTDCHSHFTKPGQRKHPTHCITQHITDRAASLLPFAFALHSYIMHLFPGEKKKRVGGGIKAAQIWFLSGNCLPWKPPPPMLIENRAQNEGLRTAPRGNFGGLISADLFRNGLCVQVIPRSTIFQKAEHVDRCLFL